MSSAAPHQRMLGAAVVGRLPGLGRAPLALERGERGLFLLWCAYAGLLAFGALLLWRAGAWHRLLDADPTGLTLVIALLFTGCTAWAGRRAWVLGEQRLALDRWIATRTPGASGDWSHEYRSGCAPAGADRATWLQVLGERAHGPHEMAWWLNGIQLKLGLLGKVIGFSILALQLGQVQTFDASMSGQLLKSLTGGLGIALLTTVTGLTGNILLGLQLMRLDRFADALIADAIASAAPPQETPDGDRPHGA
ncbi:MAG: hypothetical protein IBJ04_01575 [Hydrogenophaga sp.]|uniref:hypothetical protein n=1 Tax=Hydrogenophaga TaxID=47420 RepID=UPI00196B9FA0|nr:MULTISPECIES: hypothetical protein [Hydrogenophaga]MBL0943004.1 hypothetical protein [Hydrogenophaga sp.]